MESICANVHFVPMKEMDRFIAKLSERDNASYICCWNTEKVELRDMNDYCGPGLSYDEFRQELDVFANGFTIDAVYYDRGRKTYILIDKIEDNLDLTER